MPDAYNIGTSAAALSLGGSYYTGLGAKYLIGVDAGLNYSKTLGGGVTYMKTVTGAIDRGLHLRGAIGYPTSRPSGLTLFARLGFRYRNYSVNDYNSATGNPAKIPQENLKAPTLGFGLAMPKLTQKLGLQVTLDTILFGASITQTAGLEDGATPKMTGVNLAAGLVYRVEAADEPRVRVRPRLRRLRLRCTEHRRRRDVDARPHRHRRHPHRHHARRVGHPRQRLL